MPLPASRIRISPSGKRSSTQGVLPPYRKLAAYGVGKEPRTPHSFTLNRRELTLLASEPSANFHQRIARSARRTRPSGTKGAHQGIDRRQMRPVNFSRLIISLQLDHGLRKQYRNIWGFRD